MKNSLFVFFTLVALCASAQQGVPDDYCLTRDEYKLVQLINEHRLISGMKEIPLSASLSYVARTHVIDLYTNHPDTGVCNLNSWSDKGDWSACCHNKYVPQEACIRNKPRELTKYAGEGYELTYAEILNTSADTVFHFWMKIDEANNFLLNKGKWEDKAWRAMGVGIYKSYAVLWMGQRTDPIPKPSVCAYEPGKKPAAEVSSHGIPLISERTDRYYVIIASFQSEADARKEAGKYEKMEGADLKILKNTQGQYRISITDYPNLEEAKAGKEIYRASFTGAWILNY